MLYDSILARSFSKHEQKKLGYGALVGCLLIAFSFCIMLKPHLGGPDLNLRILPRNSAFKMLMMMNDEISNQQLHEVADIVIKKPKPICSLMERTDFCDIEANVRIHGESSSVYFASTEEISKANNNNNKTWRIRPYARKRDKIAMSRTTQWSINSVKTLQKMPNCTTHHTVPAILFSNGGYAGNHFHDFTDVLIPLFLTARKFNGNVKFLITDAKSWWVLKYQTLLSNLSNYDIVYIDDERQVRCFPRAIVGLQRDDTELGINSKNHAYSMRDFREFLRSCYSLKRDRVIENRGSERPKFVIVARRRTRSFTNIEEIRKMSWKLGFKVIVIEPDMNMKKVGEVVNSCDVMMGVHGAGLTNIVFLPKNAVFIQVVPFGGVDWVSKNYFGDSSKDMDLKYLEYKISLEESSLIQQYPKNDVVLRDPQSIQNQGWSTFKSIYLDKQNVKLDVNRFRPTLLRALELLR